MNRNVAALGWTLLAIISTQANASANADNTDDEPAEVSLLRTSAHRVTARQVGRFVEFSVQRKIFNPTATAQVVNVTWPLPEHGAVTQLRWRRDDDPLWIEGELLRVTEAAKIYQRYLDGEQPQPRGPVLATSDGPTLTLESPTLARGHALLLEYRVTTALCYTDGSYVAAYPAPAQDRDPPRLQLPKGASTTSHLPERLRDCEVQENQIEQWRYMIFPNQVSHGILTQLHRVDTPEGGVSEFIVELGQKLEAAPRHASVIFVMDASRSVDFGGLDDQLKIAADFLQHVPDAAFNIIFARRKPTPLWPRLQPARMAGKLKNLPETVTELRNGSNFDDALRMASTMLRDAAGPTYLIAFTDAQWRKSLQAKNLPSQLTGLPSTTVLHMVTVPRAIFPHRSVTSFGSDNEVGRAWDFGADCDPLAAAFGHRWRGMIVMLEGARCSGSSNDIDRSKQPPLSAQLVRPMLIENLTLDHEPIADDVREGRALRIVNASPGPRLRTLRGTIWGRTWSQTRLDDDVASRNFAAIAHTTELGSQMSPVQAEQVAVVGHAISPFTSMLAIDRRFGPGAVAAGDEFGVSGVSSAFDPCCGDIGHTMGFATVKGIEPTLQGQLQNVAVACAATQHLTTWEATITLEMTGLEIVAVNTSTPFGKTFETCVTEAVWTVWAVNPNDLTDVTIEVKSQP